MKCIVCFTKAEIIYKGNTLCVTHFERIWENETEGTSSLSLKKMKGALSRGKDENTRSIQ